MCQCTKLQTFESKFVNGSADTVLALEEKPCFRCFDEMFDDSKLRTSAVRERERERKRERCEDSKLRTSAVIAPGEGGREGADF